MMACKLVGSHCRDCRGLLTLKFSFASTKGAMCALGKEMQVGLGFLVQANSNFWYYNYGCWQNLQKIASAATALASAQIFLMLVNNL